MTTNKQNLHCFLCEVLQLQQLSHCNNLALSTDCTVTEEHHYKSGQIIGYLRLANFFNWSISFSWRCISAVFCDSCEQNAQTTISRTHWQARKFHKQSQVSSAVWNSLSLSFNCRSCKLFSTFACMLKTKLFDTAYSEHSTYNPCHLAPVICLRDTALHRVWKKRSQQFSLHNFNKCRHSFVIFGMNQPEDSFYYKNRKFIPNIIISLRSDDVIVTSFETTLSRTASGKDTTILCLITFENSNSLS